MLSMNSSNKFITTTKEDYMSTTDKTPGQQGERKDVSSTTGDKKSPFTVAPIAKPGMPKEPDESKAPLKDPAAGDAPRVQKI
jgi:hypothetical protein